MKRSIVLKESCRKCSFISSCELLSYYEKDVLGAMVHNFVNDHRLYSGAAWYARGKDLRINELPDIWTVPLHIAGLAVISVNLALRLLSSLGLFQCHIN